MFERATFEERRQYYSEEWSQKDLPDYIIETIAQREFGFDHDGTGPKDRYNQFKDTESLGNFLKSKSPFAAYSSISFYEHPERRKGYKKAELAFDIDAKDLPIKNCCEQGKVCEKCLGIAKDFVLSMTDVLEDDLGLKNIHHIYSGRGYHIRILDEDVMGFKDAERGYILDYMSGSEVLEVTSKIDWWILPDKGYTKIFRERLIDIFSNASVRDFVNTTGIGDKKAKEIVDNRDIIINEIKDWKLLPESSSPKKMSKYRFFPKLSEIVGTKGSIRLYEQIKKWNASILDAKVTVDVKRILRLPSSLHSKVSMKCMEIKDIEGFEPLRDAVPRFVEERKSP